MLKQLEELLKLQKELDEAILKEQGIVWDEKIEEQTKVALFVELGELMNEMPTKFKHWKKTAVDNREKALIEYADALHFALSLTNYSHSKGKYDDCYESYSDLIHLNYSWILNCIIWECDENSRTNQILGHLFILGNKLGFTWDEIYNAYKRKYVINCMRLSGGY